MDGPNAERGRARALADSSAALPWPTRLGAIALGLALVGGTAGAGAAHCFGPRAAALRSALCGTPAQATPNATPTRSTPPTGEPTGDPTDRWTAEPTEPGQQPTMTTGPTEAPSPSPSPTSYRVADVGVEVTCDPCHASPGAIYRYVVSTYNRGPAFAPNGVLDILLDEGASASFTGGFWSSSWACHLEGPRRALCQATAVRDSVEVEAVIAADATGGVARACASVGFWSSGGAEDPVPGNNVSCAEVGIDPSPGRTVFLPLAERRPQTSP